MQPDADRSRRRDPGPVAEQSPPAADEADQRQDAPRAASKPRYAPPQYGAPQYRMPHHGGPQYGAPQHGMPQHGAPLGAARPGFGQLGGPAQPTAGFAAPQVPGNRFAPPALAARDAPLIHPAAAQASSVLPYGIPVYQAPVYAYAPQPQRGLSITALVLGICSFLFAWTLVVVPIIGIVFGFIALRREPAGRAMAMIGLIASGIGLLWVLLFYLLPLLGVVGAMLFAMGAA